jgi:hypothetical protein
MANQNEDKLAPNTINWRIWSTAESVRNREPSVMAVAETCLAPILYLWLAFHVGWLLPLYVAIAVAPFVLLRSDKSVALGVKWVQRLQYVGWGTQRFSLQLVPSYMPAWIAAVSVMLGVFVFNTVIIFKFWGAPFSEGHAIQSTAVLCGISSFLL